MNESSALNSRDIAAMLRKAEDGSPEGIAMLDDALDQLSLEDARKVIGVLIVLIEQAHRSGVAGTTWEAFLADLT
ncbi:hypothetical protein [Cellulosimicrobium sp. SL-1]|uniref:hypothetical protein n=1 Tax=Cellulosimicrobium sp. SL-1 TaxID=2699423 RepID=UPI0013D7F0E5|nr:hypothetical protein [Cellulosimicrobium sp. SL-1]